MSISCLSINDLPLNIDNHYYAIVTTNSFERRLVYNYIGCYDTDNERFWKSEQKGNIPCMPFEDCKYSIRENSYAIASYGKYDVDYGNAVYFIFNGRRIVDIVTWYAINNVWNVEKFYTIQHFPDRFHCAEKNVYGLAKLFTLFNNLNPYNVTSWLFDTVRGFMRSDDKDIENYTVPMKYNSNRECEITKNFLEYVENNKFPTTRTYYSFADAINLHEYSVSEWINLIDKQRRERMKAITCVTEDATSSALNMLNNVGIINSDYTKNGADKALNIEVIKERFPQTYSLDEIKETEKGRYAISIHSRDEFDCIKQNYFYCDRILFTYVHINDESWYPSYVIIDGRLIVDFCYTGKISSDYHIYAFEDVKSLKMKRVSLFNIKMPKGFGLKNFHVGSTSSYPGYNDWITDITYDTINYCMNDVINTTENYKYWEVIRMLYNKIIDVIIESDMRTETKTVIDKSCNDVKHITTATPIKRTIIKWADGSTTSVECPEKDYNPYYGFAIAVAKYAMGNDNTMSNEADKWLNKIPKQRAEEQRKKDKEKAIKEQREAKNAERREHRRMKKLTMDRVRAYEKYQEEQKIREEAEKLGVPKDFEPDKT